MTDAKAGRGMIDFAAQFMPALQVATRLADEHGSLRGLRVAMALALEPKTACLAEAVASLGAEVAVLGSPNSTRTDVAAALSDTGVRVFAERGATAARMAELRNAFIDTHPNLLIDDGANNIRHIHRERRDALEHLRGAAEDTTSGVRPLRVMAAEGRLEIPCVAVNDARTKLLADNIYGTGQSVVLATLDATGLSIAGRRTVVVGYGKVGHGIARVAHALGADVAVSEVDAVAALAAYHDGFEVGRLDELLGSAEFVFTATGIGHSLTGGQLSRLPDGAIVAVGGAGPPEFDPTIGAEFEWGEQERPSVRTLRFADGKRVFLIADGYCANTSAGEGNPIDAMDLTFALQLRAVDYLATHELPIGVHTLPAEIDHEVSESHLNAHGVQIDTPTPDQQRAAAQW